MGYSKDGEYFTKDGKTLEVEVLMTSSVEGQAEMIKSMLQSLGIKVDLRSVDQKTLDSSVGDWKYDLAISGHGGMGGDPVQLTSSIIGKGFNSARYENDTELTGLLKKQGSEMDADARKKMVDRVQELCSKDVPGLALYYTESFWASNDKVKYYFTPGGVGSGVPSTLNKMIFVK
jgi:peptide/nickel transport system substrate-binding protein